MLELETFLDGLLNFGDWIVGGRGPVDRHALLVHHKLREVPFYGVDQEPRLLSLEEGPERVCVVSVDIDFGKHVEGDVVFGGELLDLLFCAGFLAAELVAGEGEDA